MPIMLTEIPCSWNLVTFLLMAFYPFLTTYPKSWFRIPQFFLLEVGKSANHQTSAAQSILGFSIWVVHGVVHGLVVSVFCLSPLNESFLLRWAPVKRVFTAFSYLKRSAFNSKSSCHVTQENMYWPILTSTKCLPHYTVIDDYLCTMCLDYYNGFSLFIKIVTIRNNYCLYSWVGYHNIFSVKRTILTIFQDTSWFGKPHHWLTEGDSHWGIYYSTKKSPIS